jgi:SAM-dependent methyltransferase
MDREGWNARYAEGEFLWKVDPNQFVVAETAGLHPGRALDLAAGEGRNAVWLAEQGWCVTAVDFSDVGIAKGRRLAEARAVEVGWVEVDLMEYQPLPDAYDLVLVCYLQVPEAQRRHIVARAREAVARGGTFLWIAHDLSNLEHGVGGPKDPAVLSGPEDIVSDLPDFEVRKAQVVERRVRQETAQGGVEERIALDTLVRAVRP